VSLSEHMTRRDGVEAVMSVAEDLSAGRLDPADVEHQAVGACRELFGVVVGPDDHPRVAPRGVATASRNTRVGVEKG
jgi:hypothetical protein